MRPIPLLAAALLALNASPAMAEICDYRLSELAGRVGTAITGRSGSGGAAGQDGGSSGSNVSVNAGGFQIVLPTMTGRTSGALGLLGSASSLAGTASSIAGSPVALFAAGSVLVGSAGLQVGCHFRDERINDYDEMLVILRRVAADMPPEVFQLVEPVSTRPIAFIRVLMRHGEPLREFEVQRLMIVNGRLVHRDFGPNTVIGDIAIFLPQPD